ncbi:hypothetical protein OL229_21975 [Neisseriaceae bacterium JH1-16]|nr:hypothetical protein [Neisseriaceae bacterium JH1-16]
MKRFGVALMGLLLLTGMGGQPWQTGRLVSVGNVPFTRLAIEQHDGHIVPIRAQAAGHGVDEARLKALQTAAGKPVRYRLARQVDTPLGPELELDAVELADAPR